MTSDLLDLDDIAADDALIESIRTGASRADLPDDDAVVDVLLAARDGAQVSAAERSVPADRPRVLLTSVTAHRRSIAAAVVAGITVTTGVGAAVAGDPTAAFKYVFDRGVDIGSRIGSPGGSARAAGEAGGPPHAVGVNSAPVRQGSAAGPLSDTREDTSVGFVRDPDFWIVPSPRGLEQYSGDQSEVSGRDGITATGGETAATEPNPDDSPTSRDPVVTTDTTDTDQQTEEPEQSPQTDGSDPSDDPTTTAIVPPTESPTESPTETDPTTPPPTESEPTETDPTETTPTPTQTTTPPSESTSPPETTSPPSSPAPSTTTPPSESPTQ